MLARRRAYLLLILLSFIFLTVLLEISYLRMYWTDLHQIFNICTYMGDWVGMIKQSFFRDRSRTLLGNRFLARIGILHLYYVG